MTTISARVVLDSVNRFGDRLITLELHYPRWIHSEILTHRVFSRNSASSRAIPVKKMIEAIRQDPAMPIFWGRNQKGMQAKEECNEPVLIEEWDPTQGDDMNLFFVPVEKTREEAWLEAMDKAITSAEAFDKAGYHKQVVNRLLEPFMHIKVLLSSTQWSNFFWLRDHEDAEPHFQLLAQAMGRAIENSHPQDRMWHLPYTEDIGPDLYDLKTVIEISCARCASVSYKTVDGDAMSPERARDVYEKLVGSDRIHASPMEHVARADYKTWGGWLEPDQHGNFTGWCQWRKTLPNECA